MAVGTEPGLGLWKDAKGLLTRLWFSLYGPCRDSVKIWPGGVGRQVTLLSVLLHRRSCISLGFVDTGCRLHWL